MARYGYLSTYPPTRCGLATFTEALAGAMAGGGTGEPTIVRVLDSPGGRTDPTVVGRIRPSRELVTGDPASLVASVRALEGCDVAIVQHEYGIYGGRDGADVVTLLRMLRTPTIVVLHTVLAAPSPHQREVLESVCESAAAVVVMTRNAQDILMRTYRVTPTKVRVIPHGVPVRHAGSAPRRTSTKRVLTWGLISPGKGLEWGIRAISELTGLASPVEYVIAGQTHPKVLAREGERYREELQRLIVDLGLGGMVTMDDRYLDPAQLADLVTTADVVLLPYDSRDQATSGVLVEAIAAGVPVVSTGFPHAVELLGGGAGLIARHGDPGSMAAAIRTIIETEETARRMHEAALRDAHDSTWPVVAERYRELADRIAAARAA